MADKKYTESGIPLYRIGDYAKYMGVTPDLLKHYEEVGILVPERSKSGYRYYPFTHSHVLMACIRLRNCGLTLKEIKDALCRKPGTPGDTAKLTDETNSVIKRNFDQLRSQISHSQLLLKNHEEFLPEKAILDKNGSDWSIRMSEGVYFLPHTRGADFLDDPRIYEILRYWIREIPIVKSAVRITEQHERIWGLLIKESYAKELQLPLNTVVEYVPPARTFFYYTKGQRIRAAYESAELSEHPAFRNIHSMNLKPAPSYLRVEMMPAVWSSEFQQSHYACYLIPVDL
ncbi:MAG: MerR family transcriptional regulator [Lachnospiraceae bacterium]|nr:MerR family transcriptional regulator [Lachnospiraceae bacterium]